MFAASHLDSYTANTQDRQLKWKKMHFSPCHKAIFMELAVKVLIKPLNYTSLNKHTKTGENLSSTRRSFFSQL